MEVLLTEEDFRKFGGFETTKRKDNLGVSVSAGNGQDDATRQAVLDALPSVLAKKLETVWNVFEGYQLKTVELKVSFGGKPFGVGVDGEMTLSFEQCD